MLASKKLKMILRCEFTNIIQNPKIFSIFKQQLYDTTVYPKQSAFHF